MVTAEKIGDFLIRIGSMKPEQCDDVINLQNKGVKRMFGEIAAELGYVEKKQ
jgi:hypothetical protein